MTNQTKPRHDIHTHPEGISVGSLVRAEMANHNYTPPAIPTPHAVRVGYNDLDLNANDMKELALANAQYAREELRDAANTLGQLDNTPGLSIALDSVWAAHNLTYQVDEYIKTGGWK